jgi:antitoxin component YwqK of YwqJK toxin-antitoxin module
MKNMLAFLLAFSTISTFAQDWDKTADIDTFYKKNWLISNTYTESGRIHKIINWDKQESIDYFYNSNGILTEAAFISEKNGIRYDRITSYFPEGAVESIYYFYVHGSFFFLKPVADSVYYHYYKSGAIRVRGHFLDGKQNGIQTTYYENGQVSGIYKYINGKPDSIGTEYYQSGQLKLTGNWVNGTPEDMLIIYHENGQLWTELMFANGRLENVLTLLDKNGNPLEKGSFNSGTGTLNIYNEDGKVIQVEHYRRGKLMKTKKRN